MIKFYKFRYIKEAYRFLYNNFKLSYYRDKLYYFKSDFYSVINFSNFRESLFRIKLKTVFSFTNFSFYKPQIDALLVDIFFSSF